MDAGEQKPQRILRRTFKFRCYPNRGTQRRLWNVMRRAATPVWNACVAEREEVRNTYRDRLLSARLSASSMGWRILSEKEDQALRRQVGATCTWPTAYAQYKHVRKRDHPEYAPYNAKMLECVVAKVDGSEKSFLSLWSKGYREARPPRPTRLHRCLTFRQSGWRLEAGRLTLAGIGTIKVRMHRPIKGKVKTVSIAEKNGRWYTCFSCEIEDFYGVCGPVAELKSRHGPELPQKYAPPGGEAPEMGGTHNHPGSWLVRSVGGEAPEMGGTHNGTCGLAGDRRSGEAPEMGGTHNRLTLMPLKRRGGEAPEMGGTHTVRQERVTLDFVFWGGVFLTDSEGREIPFPAFYWSQVETLRRLSRIKSRRQPKPGQRASRNYRKARRALANWHEHITHKRDYWLWHLARFYALNCRQVVVPKWPLKGQIQYAVDSEEARALCDRSYGKFVAMLRQKCEEFGTEFVERKDSELWEQKVSQQREVAQLESLSKLLYRAKRRLPRLISKRWASSSGACVRAAMPHK